MAKEYTGLAVAERPETVFSTDLYHPYESEMECTGDAGILLALALGKECSGEASIGSVPQEILVFLTDRVP